MNDPNQARDAMLGRMRAASLLHSVPIATPPPKVDIGAVQRNADMTVMLLAMDGGAARYRSAVDRYARTLMRGGRYSIADWNAALEAELFS